MTLFQRLTGRFGRFASDRRGSVIVELAFAVPVAIIIITGSYDAARLVLLHQKIDRASSAMADLVSQPQVESTDRTGVLVRSEDSDAKLRIALAAVLVVRPGFPHDRLG